MFIYTSIANKVLNLKNKTDHEIWKDVTLKLTSFVWFVYFGASVHIFFFKR